MTCQELKEYILEQNLIEPILENIGCHSIEFHDTKGMYSAAYPNGDNRMGVVIKICEYLNYYSYSHNINIDEGKDIFSLVQEIKKLSFSQTMRYVHEMFGLQYTFKKKKEQEIPKEDPLNIFKRVKSKYRIRNIADIEDLKIDDSVLGECVPMIHIDLYRDGIMPWTVNKFKIMYSYKWKRTIFPHHYWANGELIGYNGRSSIEDCDELGIPKYFISPGMKKECNLYGLWENKEEIEQKRYIVIGEAEKSVCKRDSRCDGTWVAVSGHSLSSEQVRVILGLDIDEIVIAFDKDIDINEIRYACEKFYHLRKVSYIWDKWGLLKEKDSPADAVNQVYQFLFKYRVIYDEKEHEKYKSSSHK